MNKVKTPLILVIAVMLGLVVDLVFVHTRHEWVNKANTPNPKYYIACMGWLVGERIPGYNQTYRIGYPLSSSITVFEYSCIGGPNDGNQITQKATKQWQFYADWILWSLPFLAIGYVAQKKLSVR